MSGSSCSWCYPDRDSLEAAQLHKPRLEHRRALHVLVERRGALLERVSTEILRTAVSDAPPGKIKLSRSQEVILDQIAHELGKPLSDLTLLPRTGERS